MVVCHLPPSYTRENERMLMFPKKGSFQKDMLVFQPPFFTEHLSFRRSKFLRYLSFLQAGKYKLGPTNLGTKLNQTGTFRTCFFFAQKTELFGRRGKICLGESRGFKIAGSTNLLSTKSFFRNFSLNLWAEEVHGFGNFTRQGWVV